MEISKVIGALGALAQEPAKDLSSARAARAGRNDGGRYRARLRLPQNTLSFHVGILARTRLVASRKVGRSIIYFVDLEGTRDLLSFLVEDC